MAKVSALIAGENTAEVEAFVKQAACGTKRPSMQDLLAAAERAERKLDKAGVAKTHRVGCEFRFREAGPWASSYGYSKAAIAFRLRRKKDGWVVVEARSENVYPKTPEVDQVNLTANAKDAVIRAALGGFGLIPAKAA